MKTLILFAALLLSGTQNFGQTSSELKNELFSEISQGFSMPSELKKTTFSENVKVELQIQTDGTVQLLQIETGNSMLRQYLETKLNAIVLTETTVGEAITFAVKLLFKVL